MIVKKYTELTCDQLQAEIGINISRYFDSKKAWGTSKDNLTKVEDGSYTFETIPIREIYGILQFNLKTENGSKDDFENSKVVYNAFSKLQSFYPSDASDPRLWIRLTHEHFHDYTIKRWAKNYNKKSHKKTIEFIRDRFFFDGTGQRTRLHNSISRLWWIPYLTVLNDEDDENRKWELTEAAFNNTDIYTSLMERTMGIYPNVRYAFLEFYLDNKNVMTGKMIQKTLKILNNYGGVTSLSMLSKDNVKSILNRQLAD